MNYSRCPYFKIQSKKRLSYLLRTPLVKLQDVDKYFLSDSFQREKRILTNPRPNLKKVLSSISSNLIKIGTPCFEFGGIPKKSAVQNVNIHVGNQYILRTDIHHFFPNTQYDAVYTFFRSKLLMSIDCATILAHLTTEKIMSSDHRSLPQGYPTSPLLSLYCYIDLFNELSDFATKNSLVLSVYYDDITMSSKIFIPYRLLHQVREIIHKYGFNAHPKKTKLVKIYKPNRKIKVTGVLVNQSGISVPKGLFKKLHESVNFLSNMLEDPGTATNAEKYNLVHQVRGRVAAIQAIDNSYSFQGYIDHTRELEKTISKEYLIQRNHGLLQ